MIKKVVENINKLAKIKITTCDDTLCYGFKEDSFLYKLIQVNEGYYWICINSNSSIQLGVLTLSYVTFYAALKDAVLHYNVYQAETHEELIKYLNKEVEK